MPTRVPSQLTTALRKLTKPAMAIILAQIFATRKIACVAPWAPAFKGLPEVLCE